jgi:hypothetical protein
MRRLILLGLLAVIAIPAGAAKPGADTRITVAQLERALTAAGAAQKSDAAIAHEIQKIELSEQLTEATLQRLSTNLQSDPKAALALQLLADQSAFLDPPASELPSAPAPDTAAQKQLLDAARNYVAQTLMHLPNFLATQTVKRFDNSGKGGSALQLEETSSREVSTRALAQKQIVLNRLTSWGEFGSALGTVVNDTARGTVTWGYWEQTPAGPAAVFHFSVPKAASHFEVILPAGAPVTTGSGGGIMEGFGNPQAALEATRSGAALQTGTSSEPAYGGSLWLDPATGTVLRITMEADPKEILPYKWAAMMVQYGQVRIGDGDYICPLRSIFSLTLKEAALHDLAGDEEDGPTHWLSESLFTGYHRFKSTAQILSDAGTSR